MTFQWDPTIDQIYTGNTLTLNGTPSSFNKQAGKNFRLDAPDQTLTLKAAATAADRVTGWGINGTSGTLIEVIVGTLAYDGGWTPGQPATVFDLAAGQEQTNLIIEAGNFQIENTAVVQSTGDLYLIQSGGDNIQACFFSINCSECKLNNIFAQLGGTNSKISIIAGLIKISSNFEFIAQGYSEVMFLTDGPSGIIIENLYIESCDRSKILMNGQLLSCKGSASINARGNGSVALNFNSIEIEQDCKFNLRPQAATMKFDVDTGNGQPFDFLNKTYPQGIFSFTSDIDGPNNSEFIIKTNGDHTIPWILVRDKLIAIDGVPVDNPDLIYCAIETNAYLHIRLRN